MYVKFGEEGAAGEAVNSLGDQWGYVMVFLGPSVDWAVVLDWAKLAIFLFDEKEVRGIRTP